ncbi:MAG: gamma-glutamyl-phosphate reductase, partial [Chromatocurvus sp.]
MTIEQYMRATGAAAREASRHVAAASTAQRNAALLAIRNALAAGRDAIANANADDLAQAEVAGLTPALRDRLALTPARIDAMLAGLAEVEALPDPVGEITELSARPSGIRVGRMR